MVHPIQLTARHRLSSYYAADASEAGILFSCTLQLIPRSTINYGTLSEPYYLGKSQSVLASSPALAEGDEAKSVQAAQAGQTRRAPSQVMNVPTINNRKPARSAKQGTKLRRYMEF